VSACGGAHEFVIVLLDVELTANDLASPDIPGCRNVFVALLSAAAQIWKNGYEPRVMARSLNELRLWCGGNMPEGCS
jgi:hypothetical protein